MLTEKQVQNVVLNYKTQNRMLNIDETLAYFETILHNIEQSKKITQKMDESELTSKNMGILLDPRSRPSLNQLELAQMILMCSPVKIEDEFLGYLEKIDAKVKTSSRIRDELLETL